MPTIAQNYISAIQSVREKLEKSIVEIKEAIMSEATAMANEKSAKIDWITQYRKDYGTLIQMYPNEKSFCEGFFPKFRSRSVSDTETDTQTGTN